MNSTNKKLFLAVILSSLFALAGVGLKVKLVTDRQEQNREFEARIQIQDKKIEELQKEIRILKTDVHVLQYGFEVEE